MVEHIPKSDTVSNCPFPIVHYLVPSLQSEIHVPHRLVYYTFLAVNTQYAVHSSTKIKTFKKVTNYLQQ